MACYPLWPALLGFAASFRLAGLPCPAALPGCLLWCRPTDEAGPLCQTAYTPPAMPPLGVCLYLVISACTRFGLLTRSASRRLGDISYGIYLHQ